MGLAGVDFSMRLYFFNGQVGGLISAFMFCVSIPAEASSSDVDLAKSEASTMVRFAAPLDLASGRIAGVTSLDAGDLNGDGKADVVVLEGGMSAEDPSFVWLQAPAQSGGVWEMHDFTPDLSLKRFLGSARLADMNGDGSVDLVFTSDMHSGETVDADVFVLINPLLNGSLNQKWEVCTVATGLPLHHINDMELADMDQDGKMDIIARSLVPNEIHIFFQDSPTSWVRKSIQTELPQSEGLAVGRLNADELPDVSFTGYILRAPMNPRFEDYIRISVDTEYAQVNQNTKEMIGDIDGDGHADLLLAPAEAYRGGKAHDLAWYRNPGGDLSGEWEKHVILAKTNQLHTAKLALVNDDLHLDVVTGAAWDPESIRIYYNMGRGEFSVPQVVSEEFGLYTGVVIDFDADGDLDIIGQETYSNKSRPLLYENLSDTEIGD